MLIIRLSKVGKKNKPMYRLIISEKARDPYGRALEILGFYNPHTKELKAKNERIKYWISKGSQMSPTVNNLLIEKNVIDGDKVKASKAKKKKKDKKEKKGATEAKVDEKVEKSASAKATEDKKEEKTEENKTETPEKPKEPSNSEAVEDKEVKAEEKTEKE